MGMGMIKCWDMRLFWTIVGRLLELTSTFAGFADGVFFAPRVHQTPHLMSKKQNYELRKAFIMKQERENIGKESYETIQS